MWYRLIHNRRTTVVGGRDAADPAFEVSAQIVVMGDRGFLDSAHGAGFYALMREHGTAIMAELGIKSLEGYVLPSHLRLMRAALAGVGDVRAIKRGTMAGHDMIWICVTPVGIDVDDPDRTLDVRAPIAD